jgi:carbonic anhydrase/acetyltransferase-like protein (isoleucine patch superfamily)
MAVYSLEGLSPQLPADGAYWIAPSAMVIGKVRLDRHATVWFGAVLRGDNEWITIGERTNIQDLAILHTDPGIPLTLGADVTEVAPVSWTPEHWNFRSPPWQESTPLMRRSFGAR